MRPAHVLAIQRVSWGYVQTIRIPRGHDRIWISSYIDMGVSAFAESATSLRSSAGSGMKPFLVR